MNGSFGIRAMSLVRKTDLFVTRHLTDTPTRNLPSWVPDLASREYFGLSTNGGGFNPDEKLLCFNIMSKPSGQPFHINGGNLSVRGHRIGRIVQEAEVFPNKIELETCINFALTLTSVLRQLPHSYPHTNQTPFEALVQSFRLGEGHGTSPIDTAFIESYLITAIKLYIWNRSSHWNESIDNFFDTLNASPKRDVWSIAGLSDKFPNSEEMQWTLKRLRAEWLLTIIPPSIEEAINTVTNQCKSLRREYGDRLSATKVFFVETARSDPEEEQLKLLGIGPDVLRDGHDVYAFSGSEWPVIVRENGAGNVSAFIGEAYLHGVMHGELFQGSDSSPRWEDIVLG